MNNWKLYIANRIHFDKQHRKKATPPAVRVAVAGVALGLAIMILSVAIVIGFKKRNPKQSCRIRRTHSDNVIR